MPLPSVAIVGRPNVGKSELFNRLTGGKAAIVHDQPGVTRDRLSGICEAGARPFRLWDTGGIGGAGESELTSDVRSAVDAAIRESDVLLFLVDAQDGLSPIDRDLARLLRKARKPVLLVVNKIDHPKHEDLSIDFDQLGFDITIPISAAHARGITDLLENIDARLPKGDAQELEQVPQGTDRPLLIAIVGRPNVGKSSLVNAITRTDRAIVSELPGTTRDAVDISYRKAGDNFVFIDTAGMRRRGRHSSSVEVFSVMRAERSIRRAHLCVLTIDITSGVTAQDKKIAGLIQDARKPAIMLVNKFDLIDKREGSRQAIENLVEDARHRLFFLDYAPVLVASALTGQHVTRLFRVIGNMKKEAKVRVGTGQLNRILRAAVAANPPPMVSGKRLKLFYATQTTGPADTRPLPPPEFVLFVNDPRLLGETYRRFLEGQIRACQPYEGLPIQLTLRPRTEKEAASGGKRVSQ